MLSKVTHCAGCVSANTGVVWIRVPTIFGTLDLQSYRNLGTPSQNFYKDIVTPIPISMIYRYGDPFIDFQYKLELPSLIYWHQLTARSLKLHWGPHIYGVLKSIWHWEMGTAISCIEWPYSKVGRDSSKAPSLCGSCSSCCCLLCSYFPATFVQPVLLWKMQVLWDKPKYIGPGKKKQCSLKRCCLAMKADILSTPSLKRKEQGW